jgi:hypothetical protein
MFVYTELVRQALNELADADYQRRVWAGEGGDEMSSFEECVELLFGDSGLDVALERSQPVYGSTVDDELRKLHDLVARINGSRSTEEILQDPALDGVRELASAILLAMEQQGRSGVI